MLLALCPLEVRADKAATEGITPSAFNGSWRRDDNGSTVTITVKGNTVAMIYTPGTPDYGTIEKNKISYRSTSEIDIRTPSGEVKTVTAVDVGTITLSADGDSILKQRVLSVPGMADQNSKLKYNRVK